MRRLFNISLPGRWAVYLGASLLVSALIVLGGILPLVMQHRQQAQTIVTLEQDLIRKQVMTPLYTAVTQELATPPPLPAGAARKLPTPQTVEELPGYLGKMAQASGIARFTFIPVPQSLDRGAKRLAVSATLSGPPERLRNFLASLAMAQDFVRLQETDLSGQNGAGDVLQARLLFWLKLPGSEA